MRTNIVLVDYENVQPHGLERLDQPDFRVLVFVGTNQAKIPFEFAVSMQRLGSRAEYVRISGTGRNALDFHIAYYIGQLSAQTPGAYFHIISNDTGFDPLILHLKSRKILSDRCTRIEDIPLLKTAVLKSPEERAESFLLKLRQLKTTRPRTQKTLHNAVAAFFNKQLSEPDVSAVVSALQTLGALNLVDGKVAYVEAS